jgi:glucose/arabinose dehydrogenase
MRASAFRRSLLPCAAALFFGFCGGPGGRELGANGAPRQDAVQDASILGPVSVSITLFVSGLANPLDIARSGDGSGRLFVTEQAGRIRIVRNGVLEARPFLDIASRVLAGGERGLLCAAFPPGFATKRYFYVNYTRNPDGATVVSRIRLTADPDLADASQEEVILIVPQPFANHNGGQLAFGPRDGYLYIALGDGGSGGDPFGNGQNPAALLGKILRIDTESGVPPYAVPPTNPFVSQSGTRPEIWALGLGTLAVLVRPRNARPLHRRRSEPVEGRLQRRSRRKLRLDLYEGNQFTSFRPAALGEFSPPVAEYDHTLGAR